MIFCTKCGSPVEGSYCSKCGAPVSDAVPVSATVSSPPSAPQAGRPAKRKTSPIAWILIVVLGLFILGAMAVIGGGFFLYQKAKQAGIDAELIKTSPALAMSKMIAATNPNVEVIKVDENRGLITLKEKKTGKIVTINFEDAKNGKITFQTQDAGSGRATVEFGAASAKMPSWIPAYPQAKAEGTFAMKGNEGESGSFHFRTSDSATAVIRFYKDGLKQAGMKVTSTESGEGGMVMGNEQAADRKVVVTVNAEPNSTAVNIAFTTKE
jgi:hypothetical protein